MEEAVHTGIHKVDGGSSFISGHEGCNAINEDGEHTGSSIHYSKKTFEETLMIDGAGYEWKNERTSLYPMPSVIDGETYESGKGNVGDGYAKITLTFRFELNKRNEYIKTNESMKIDLLQASEFGFTSDGINPSDWSWSSSNEDVATVDGNGLVTGKAIGSTTITAYNSKLGYKGKVIVNVYRNKEGAITTPQVEIGEGFTVVLKEDGTVWTAGQNNVGQLGVGDTTNRNTPVQVKIDEDTYLTNVRKISVGYAHTAALTTDGKVYAWGINGSGQLGIGDRNNKLYATKVKGINGEGYIENIIDIANGDLMTYLLDKDGNTFGMGDNNYYQIDETDKNNRLYPSKVTNMDKAIQVIAGNSNVAVIKSNCETWIKGDNDLGCFGNGTTTPGYPGGTYLVGTDINEIQLSVSGYILKEDGTVWSTGYNNVGQLGLGDTTTRTTYTQVMFENKEPVKAKTIKLKIGSQVLQFIGQDGKVYVTGYNGNGQLSNGTTTNSYYPIAMLNEDRTEVSNAISLTVGTCAWNGGNGRARNIGIIRDDGTVWISGDNTYGQLGNGNNTSSTYLTQFGTILSGVLEIKNEYIKVNEEIKNTLNMDVLNVFIDAVTKNDGWEWSSSNDDIATVDINGTITGKNVGHTTITAYNSKAGYKAKAIINVYRDVDGAITVPEVGIGSGFTVVLKEDGTVWTSGKNNVGQLGGGDTTDRNIPVQVKINEDTYLQNVRKISAGNSHVVAMTTEGELYSWGRNYYGQLGVGDTTDRVYATKVQNINEKVIDIDTEDWVTRAITENGKVLKAGANAGKNFVKEQNYDAIKIVTLFDHNETIRSNGETKHNDTTIGTDINEIEECGERALLKEDGTVWKNGKQVQFADESFAKAKNISRGYNSLQFIGEDGKVYVIGANTSGQFSNGTTEDSSYAIPMLNTDGTELTDVILLSKVYNSNNLGVIKEDGTVWISGENGSGQVGNGSYTTSKYLTQFGISGGALNIKNEYIKVNEEIKNTLEIDTFNVFIDGVAKKDGWEWSSSNSDVATVDVDGVVTGKGVGHTTITAYNTKTGLKGKAIINVYRNVEGAITVPQIEIGSGFTVVLKEDGTVWASGKNNVGQLGGGDTTDRNIPVQVKINADTYLENVRRISVGNSHVVAMTTEGELYSWGRNYYGQLGVGDTTDRVYATKVPNINEKVIDIDTEDWITRAITENGKVLKAGAGPNSSTNFVKEENYDAIKIISMFDHNETIRSNGETKRNDTTIIGTDINEIEECGERALLKEDGTVWKNGKQVKFADESFAKAKNISRGYNSLQFIGEDGKVYVIGANGSGQLSNGTTNSASYAIPMLNKDGTELTDAILLSKVYNSNNLGVIKENGTVWISGANASGQLGNKSNTDSKYLTKFGHDNTNIQLNVRNEYIKVNENIDIDILKAEQEQFNVFIQEKDILNQSDWTWSSSNEDVATINENGVVTGKGVGHTTITGRSSKDELKAKAIINVYRNVEGAVTVPQAEEGEGFTAVLKEDGTVWTSGKNNVGQLGVGDTTNRNIPVQVKIDEDTYLTNVRKISVAYAHTVAMTTDGEVYTWGLNDYGQLGQGNTGNCLYATKVRGVNGEGTTQNIIDIVAGDHMVYVLDKNGNTFGIGYNEFYQIDESNKNNKLYPTKVTDMEKVIQLTSGYSNIAVIKSNSEVWIKGNNEYGCFGNGTVASNPNPGGLYLVGTDIDEIKLGGYSGYILKEDGTIRVSGRNEYGQLGLGDTTDRKVYTQVKFSDGTIIKAKTISGGSQNFQFIGEDGKVYVTGANGSEQLSNGTTNSASYAIPMLNADGTEVTDSLLLASGGNCVYNTKSLNMGIIRQDGTVWISGDNTYGQIGNGTNTSSNYLTKMGDGFVNYPDKTITLNINETYNIDSSLFKMEDDMNVFIDDDTKFSDLNYEIEDDAIATLEGNVITGKVQGITKVTVKDPISGVTTYIWVKVVNEKNTKIDSGSKFSVALKHDGTVWSWGQNNYGQLGLNDNINYEDPRQVTGMSEKATNITAGYHHSIALTENKEVYTWGYNYYGQLGDESNINSSIPKKVEGLENIIKVDAYKYISIALNENGEVFVWGQGYGSTPTKLKFSKKIIDIAGDTVLTENRRVYDLNEKNSYGRDIIKLSAGENHYLALSADGEVFTWGTNTYGQLGNGNNASSNNVSKVLTSDGTKNINNIVEVSAGNNYSIISDKDGNVYTFGHNSSNKLAGGDTRNKPLKIENLSKIELVNSSDGDHTLISDWDGYVYTAGLNDAGQLGLGDKNSRSTFEMIGELQIRCNPEKIILHQGETQDISMFLGSYFNLKRDGENDDRITKSIANESIATLSGNTVIANKIGKTMLSAYYEGTVGSISTEIKKFYRNIEIYVIPEGGLVVPKVESGNGFTASLKADGTVWTWGNSLYGQLGIGNTDSHNEPQKVSIIKETITNDDGTKSNVNEIIEDIAVGNYHVLALGETGKVYSWGLGNYGQIGIGQTYSQYTPTIVTDINGKQLTDIVKIEAHDEISFAINSKGEVYAWGKGYSKRAQKLDVVENVLDVTSKYALSKDGQVYNILTKEIVPIVGRVVELDEGTDHTVMLAEEGKAYAIGNNTYGQLANGNNVSNDDTPVAIRKTTDEVLIGIKEIKAGDKNTVIVLNDGKVLISGINDNNELGIENKETLDKNLPVENTNISDVIFATAGDNHITVIKNDGTVYAWGNGKEGQLGNRKNKNSIEPVMVGDYIVRTNTNKVVLGVNSQKVIEGSVEYFNVFNNDIININYESKDSSVVQLLEYVEEESSEDETSEETTKEETNHKIKIKLLGKKVGTTIVTANQENSSNIGVIQVEVIPEGKEIEPNVITVGSHTIALRVDGKVYTYGNNTYGQLGDGTTKYSDEPIEVKFPEGTIITQIASGENHNVALDKEGNVWTWGRNNNYQIGHSGGSQYTPYKVTGLPKVIRIAAGNNNTMVITKNNELYAWGLNAYGNLGLENYTNKVLPTKVIGITDIIDISGGKNHYIILNRAGEVFTTGSNLYGQLGLGTNESGINEISKVNEFTKVNIDEKIGTIDAGELSNIVTTIDGEIYVWGANNNGQLATGDKENKYSPTKLTSMKDIREVDTGKSHTIIRDGNKKVYVTGANNYGQLGIGNKDSKEEFIENTKMDNVMRVSAGNTYTTILKEDGFVWACGDYNHGDKSKKSRTNSKIPVLVGSDTSSLDSLEMIIMKSETKSIMANAKFKFNLIYIEENDKSKFKYGSYNNEIAKVDEDGDVLGIREGTTWVKVMDDNTGKEHIIIVRVIDNTTEYQTHVGPQVSAGENFAIGLKEDGTVWTWGYDDTGLAETNIPSNSNVIQSYKKIDSGKNFGLAIREDGTVWSVGNNQYGQLGIGSNLSKAKLVQVESLTDIEQVSAGDTHSLAIDKFGIVYGWGSNANKELGEEYKGNITNIPQVLTIPNERIMQISAGKNQSAFVTANGTVYAMGTILNGYIEGIDNAVKVDVGDNYILILRADGTIYKYQYGRLVRIPYVSNAIDISAQNKMAMYQSVDEKAYTWGINTYGQLGNNSISSTSVPVQPVENSTNVFSIGLGFNNTFIIANTGFVYAAGTNTYGELGNGTNENEDSETKELSKTHTLVGDRRFEITPNSNTLEINEIEDLGVESNTFNVFSEKKKDLSEYNWQVEDTNILTVLSDAKIQATNIGTTNVIATDKVTGEEKQAIRVVVPLDTDRIESITASGKEANVTDVNKYEARIPVDDTAKTSEVIIKTKLGTDEISIDGGENWTKGKLITTVDITKNEEDSSAPILLPFIVRTEAGNILDYELTIIKESNNNRLLTIQVTNDGAEKTVNKIDDKTYEVIVPVAGTNTIKVIAEHEKAYVSIKGKSKEIKEQQYDLTMTKPVEEVPIKITSESGKEEKYTLIVYRNDATATLNKVYVNNKEATKVGEKDYRITIDRNINLSEIKAITSVSTSKVGINGSIKETRQIIKQVETRENETIVTIQVENVDNTVSEEYTLIINKGKIRRELIKEIKVNELLGNPDIIAEISETEENTYEVQLQNPIKTIDVIANTLAEDAEIKILDDEYAINETRKQITLDSAQTEVTITVRPQGEPEEEYKLIIKTLSDDTSLELITVNGKVATYNNLLKRYEVKVDKTETEYDITAVAKDTGASLTIENTKEGIVTQIKTINATVNKSGEATIVPIKVKAQNEISETTYDLAIIEKSNVADLNNVKVNDIEITPQADGNYIANINSRTDKVKVYARAENYYAKVTVDDETKDKSEVTINRNITQETTIYNIEVLAEDGITTITKTLTINKLRGNTDVTSVQIGVTEGTLNATLLDDGTYYCKVKRQDTADVTVTLSDAEASVSIAGQASKKQTSTEKVTLLNERTQVNATVEAQDGTQRPIVITIEKESNDASLLKIISPDAMKISYIGSNKYELQVDDRLEKIKIDAVTKNENASLKLGTETEYTKNRIIDKEVDISSANTFTIDVLAEDGVTTKTYIVEVTKKFSTKIKEITTDEEKATNKDNIYNGWINNDDIANIVITADNPNATVSIYKNAELLSTATGIVTIADTVTTKTETYKIVVEGPDSESSTYVLNVTKKSTNNNIEYVKVNEEIVEENTDTGEYKIEVGTAKEDKYELEIKAEDEYARIKLDEGEFSQTNIIKEEYEIQPGETKQVKVTVKSQNGEEIEKIVKIYRKDNNLNVETVQITAGGISKDITSTYDKKHKNYSIILDDTITEVDLTILVASEKTKIESTIDETDYENMHQLDVTGISVPGVGKKVITFTVTSEEGTKETRTITIAKTSSSIELETVTVNGKKAAKRQDGDYEIIIGDEEEIASIYAKTIEEASKISINGNTERESENTTQITNIKTLIGSTIEIPIKVIAINGEEYEYKLYITIKSGDTNLQSVKVDGKEASKIDDTTYRIFVEETAMQKPVQIITANEKTMVTAKGHTGHEINFPQQLPTQKTEVEFIVTTEAGETKEYTLEIIKESSDNTLKNVYVNGVEITKDTETGRYKVAIEEQEGNPLVKVITNNEFAYVRIGLSEEGQGQKEETVTLDAGKITTVPITIRSQTGVTNIEYLDIEKIYTINKLDTVVVDDKEITTYDVLTKTYTAIVDGKINPHEIFIMCENSYATLEINGDTGTGNVTTFVEMKEEELEKSVKLKITGESGEVEEYTIKLVKKSTNVKLKEVKVNDVTIQAEPDRPDIYKRNIKKLADKAKIKVTTEYPYASIKIGDCPVQIGTSEQWINLSLLEEVITVPVLVTATDGETIETYNIILTRGKDDTTLTSIIVNENIITPDEDEIYKVEVEGSTPESNVKITTTDPNATIKLADASDKGTLNANVTLTGAENVFIIKVIAEDGTEKEYKLIITRQTNIAGKIITENTEGKHKSLITVYKTTDTREENEKINTGKEEINTGKGIEGEREVIKQTETQEDGTFVIEVKDIEKYDVIVTKPGYLDYKVIKIEVTKGEKVTLDDYNLIAGDVVKTGEIEIDDLTRLGNNYGAVTEENKEKKEKYDLNEDAKIDSKDRNILKKNYGKKAETKEWENPLPAVLLARTRTKTKTKGEGKEGEEDEEEETEEITEGAAPYSLKRTEQKLVMPLETKYTITSPYGYRKHPTTGEYKKHTGIDLVGAHHGNILAVTDGEIVYSGVNTAFGNCIEIKHTYKGETIYSFYAHLSRRNVKVGDKVVQGQVIGLEGGASTDENHGWSTGHHLHFEIRKASGYGNDVDPNDYFDF